MATSITYKGSELASFSNNTKTLKTAGKYLEGDIIVANTITTQTKSTTVIPSESAQTVTLTPDSGNDGLSSASVTVSGITSTYVGSSVPQRTNEDLSFSGGSFTGPSGYYASNLNKNISVGALQTPTINSSGLVTASAVLGSNGSWLAKSESPKTLQLPTQSATTIVPAETTQTLSVNQKYMTGDVTVAAITPTYVGSGVTTNPTITVSGPSVTIPAGYYSSQQTKTIPDAEFSVIQIPSNKFEATTGSGLTIGFDNSTGQIIATFDGAGYGKNFVTTNGYVDGSTTVPIYVYASTSQNLTTQGATTITPSNSTQTIASGKYLTGTITVNPIPSNYIIPSGSISITSNTTSIDVSQYATANVNVQPNLTTTVVTATSTTQTITPPSGYVGFSTVTVNAITLVTYYTGITTPASNFGNNGDIYLVTD